MPLLKNPATGKVSSYEGEAALAALKLGYVPVDNAPVYTNTGSVAPQDVAELERYRGVDAADPLEQESARYVRGEERAFQREYGDTGGQVRAGAEGVASGATLGLYDVAADALGADTEKYAKANPNARLTGEVAGMLGSAVLGGGLGSGARSLLAGPAGFVSAQSARIATGGLARGAIAAATEGAGYAAVQTFSHAAIQDEPLAAGALLSEFGENIAMGGGLGAVGGALSHGLAKAGTALTGSEKASAPLLDLAGEEGSRAVKSVAANLDDVERLSDDIVRKFDPKPKAGAPRATSADEVALDKGPLSADDIPHPSEVAGPSRQGELDLYPAQAPAPRAPQPLDPADAPLQRRKIAKSVGDQVTDQALLAGDGVGIRRLKTAYARMDEAVTFAAEAKTAASVSGANRALKAYEDEVASVAGKYGMDVGDQLSAGTRGMELESEFFPGSTRKVRQGVRASEGRQTIEGVSGGPKEPARLPVDDAVETFQPLPTPEPNTQLPLDFSPPAFSADLQASRTLARKALGATGKMDLLTHKSITGLLQQEPAQMLTSLNRLDDYFSSLRKTVEATGDLRYVRRVEKALDGINESVAKLTGGLKLDEVDRAQIALALGSESMAKATFANPVVDSLHSMAVLSKMTHEAARLPPGVTRSSVIKADKSIGNQANKGGLLRSMAARGAGRGAATAAGNLVPGGGVANAIGTGMAAAAGYHVVRAIAAIAGGVGPKIGSALGIAARVGSKLARPATLTAAHLIRHSNWDFTTDALAKKTHKHLRDAFADRANELAAVSAHPEAAQKAIHESLRPLRMSAPGVADELEMQLLSIPLYLADKAPKDPGNSFRLGKSMWRPSDYEILQFGEHMKGAVAPMQVFEGALNGNITPQAAEAVRTLHPKLFQEMQIEVYKNADELRSKLDYQAQVRLSVMFDVPVTSTMRPEFRRFMNERFIARAQASKPPGGSLGPSNGGASALEPATGVQQLLK